MYVLNAVLKKHLFINHKILQGFISVFINCQVCYVRVRYIYIYAAAYVDIFIADT